MSLPGFGDFLKNNLTPNQPEEKPGGTPGSNAPVFQMLWDCKFCDTKKLLGVDNKFCPNCGSPQAPEMRYFPTEEDKKAISDPNYKYAGVDKLCPYCQTPNSAAANFCKQCGGDLTGAKQAELKVESAATVGQAEDLVKKNFEAEMVRIGVAPDPNAQRNWMPVILGVIAVIAAVGGLLFFLSRSTYKAELQVAAMQWERTITVERLAILTGSDWQDSMPGDAYNVSCTTRDRTYTRSESYQCGTTRIDRGDGSFSEQPKYCTRQVQEQRPDRWCSYTYNRWTFSRNLVTSGGPADEPVWASFTPSGNIITGAEREAGRFEKYVVKFAGLGDKKGQEFIYEAPDFTKWKTFAVNQTYELDFNRLENALWDTLKETKR